MGDQVAWKSCCQVNPRVSNAPFVPGLMMARAQVFAAADGTARVLWITDLLPDEVKAPIAQMVDAGTAAMQRTLEQSFHP